MIGTPAMCILEGRQHSCWYLNTRNDDHECITVLNIVSLHFCLSHFIRHNVQKCNIFVIGIDSSKCYWTGHWTKTSSLYVQIWIRSNYCLMCLHLEFGVINIAIHITAIITDLSELRYCNNFDFHISLFKSLTQTKAKLYIINIVVLLSCWGQMFQEILFLNLL